MLPLNPFLRAFFRSTIPAQCVPVQDHILLVPTTDVLLNAKDRDSGSHYSDLAGIDEFLGSHVLRVPKDTQLSPGALPASRESRSKAKQYSTFNGRTVVIKDSWVYSNKGFKTLNHAQLLNDVLYYPDVVEPQQWLIYFISRPLIGSLEFIPVGLKMRPKVEPAKPSTAGSSSSAKIRNINSFGDILSAFPMIARQMQPGLERIFHNFSIHAKPLPETPSSMSPGGTTQAGNRAKQPAHTPPVPLSPNDTEETMRTALENAIYTAIDLFQRVDQSQLHLLATTTDVTGTTVERLIERYVAEHLHDLYVFPRLCALKKGDDDLLGQKISEMEYIDVTQVGIPLQDQQAKASVLKRVQRGMECLERISEAKSPAAMMDVLLETMHALTTSEEEDEVLVPGRYVSSPTTSIASEEKPNHQDDATANPLLTMNADMLVSLLLIVVIRSRLKGLQSCLSYMRMFNFTDDVEQGERGYALSTLEAVLFHITVDSEQMGKASKRNGELWRRVRRGNLNGVKSLLEKKDGSDDIIDDAMDEIAALDDDGGGGGGGGDDSGKGKRSRNEPEVMFEDWVHRAIDLGEPMPRRVSLTGTKPPPNIVASPAEEEEREMLEPLHKTSKIPIQELVPELDLDPVDPDFVMKPLPEEEAPPLIGEYTRSEQYQDVDDEVEAEVEAITEATVQASEGQGQGAEHDGEVANADRGLPMAAEGTSDGLLSNGIVTEPTNLNLETEEPSRLHMLPPMSPQLPLEINLLPASPMRPTETDDVSSPPPESSLKSGGLGGTSSGRPNRTNLKTKFNPEVEYDDSPRNKMTRTLSMRSSHSHLSFASSFNSVDRLTRSQTLNEDFMSVEKLSKTRNAHGDSVVMMAITEGQKKVLEYLLNESTYYPLNWLLEDENNEGTTLLSGAVQGQDLEIIEILLNVLLQAEESAFRVYLEKSDWMLRTVGHYLFNTPDLIHQIGYLIPWTNRDRNGQTPLFALCRSYDHPRYKEMVIAAIRAAEMSQADSQVLHLDDHIDAKGNTLLHIVHDQSILKMLLKRDAEINAINEKGFTALMLASKYGRIDTVKTLFNDKRVNILAREYRGLTAVELAKDDEARNKFDDLVMFSYPPKADGRVTAVVRGIFVEDGTIRLVLKSCAPVGEMRYSITTCRRSLGDFQFLTDRLAHEHPASWMPEFNVVRSPFQIPSKPSRAVLRDVQTQANNFLQTLLSHSTFSTHELLWEFFLVPDLQPEMMEERSKRKGEIRAETVQEDYSPVDDVKDVEVFVAHAKEMIRGLSFASKSVVRRTNAVRRTSLDLADAHSQVIKILSSYPFLEASGHLRGFSKMVVAISPTEADPLAHFLEEFRNIHASLSGVVTALDRPRKMIYDMGLLNKEVEKHIATMRRSDRAWPLGLMDDTRARYHQEAAENVRSTLRKVDALARELRYSQSVTAAELAAFHGQHEQMAKTTIRKFVRTQVEAEKEKLRALQRALRVIKRSSGTVSRPGTANTHDATPSVAMPPSQSASAVLLSTSSVTPQ